MHPESPESSKKTLPLFRKNAVEHLSSKQYGTVILAKSFSFRVMTVIFTVIASALIAFFFLFSTTRKAQASGVLTPSTGVTRIFSMQSGNITQKFVNEGQKVKQGDVLFILRSERNSIKGIDTQKTISDLLRSRRDSFGAEIRQSAKQAQQRLNALQIRIRGFEDENRKLDEQIAIQKQRLELSEQSLKRYAELQSTNYISPAQLQDRQAALLEQKQRLTELNRIKSSNYRDLNSAQAELLDMQVQRHRDAAAIERNLSSVEQDLTENEAKREFLVVAPHDGYITTLNAELGQSVTTSQTLAAILPIDTKLEAEIYVPSRSIGFIKPGMAVLLRIQAYPYEKFGQYAATVREVERTSLKPEELSLPTQMGDNHGQPIYRIRLALAQQHVKVYGEMIPLKSGMAVDASIILDKRRLYEWVLEPLFSISGRL
ncbi:HlyD family secretion protein [Undibacterium sp. Di26W]|uniref:HlyD family secretion protein n=1 Tax=Undibacterium sp. Di26W TaxID=3413035 RepID=UPI003BF12A8C